MLVLKAPGVILMVVARRKMSHIGGSLRAAEVARCGEAKVAWSYFGLGVCPGEYQGVLIACQLFWQHNGEEMQVTGSPLEPKGRSAGDPEVQARPPAAIVWDAFSTVRPTEGAVEG